MTRLLFIAAMPALFFSLDGQTTASKSTAAAAKAPEEMTKMVVRLSGPGIKEGSFSALPKTIYRAGDRYARIEDPPDARQQIQKLTIIAEPDAYGVNLIDKTGTHVLNQGNAAGLKLPIVLALDPQHKLDKLDRIEFGEELEFFEASSAHKQSGPVVNSQATDAYVLETPAGTATLVVRSEGGKPVSLSWQSSDGLYRYEYIEYEDLPFQAELFKKPEGISYREIPPDPDAGTPGR